MKSGGRIPKLFNIGNSKEKSFIFKLLYFSTAQLTGKMPNIFSVSSVKPRI